MDCKTYFLLALLFTAAVVQTSAAPQAPSTHVEELTPVDSEGQDKEPLVRKTRQFGHYGGGGFSGSNANAFASSNSGSFGGGYGGYPGGFGGSGSFANAGASAGSNTFGFGRK